MSEDQRDQILRKLAGSNNFSAGSPPHIPDHELLRCIGKGSYGEVWLARNVMGTFRAVKIVYRNSFEHERPYEREFGGIKKFEPISRSHSGMVDILQVGRNDREGYFYYVMELADDEVNGQQISPDTYAPKMLSSEMTGRRRRPFEECLQLGLSLTSAIGYLHKQGLIHRDIKPSNIIFVNGVPKLADIGLVTAVGADTIPGGTLGYMSPEGTPTPQGDIYSLGKVLYEIATGNDRHEFPELPSQFEQEKDWEKLLEFNQVILKACENDPRKRYRTAEDFRADLVLLEAGTSIKRMRILEKRFAVLAKIGVAAGMIGLVAAGAYYEVYRGRNIARELLAGSYVAYGVQTMERGDLSGSLPWFAQALQLNHLRGLSEQTDRARLGAVLRECPRLLRLWFRPGLINYAEFSADGRYVLTAGLDGVATIWDVDKHSAIGELRHGKEINKASFSPDGTRIATASEDRTARVWNAANGHQELLLEHPLSVFGAKFSPDGSTIVTACGDEKRGIVRIWSATNGALLVSFPEQQGALRSASFSPDSRWIVTAGEDSTARVLDVATQKPIGSPMRHTGGQWVYQATFSPDGRNVVTACSDSTARIWEAATGLPIRTLRHVGPVRHAEFSPDGRYIVTAVHDFNTLVWDARTGEAVISPIKHNSYVFHASFSPEGRRILTANTHGAICLWDISTHTQLPIPVESLLSQTGLVRFPANTFTNVFFEVKPNRDGSRLAVVATETRASKESRGTTQLWDALAWKPVSVPFVITNRTSQIWVSHNGFNPMLSDDGTRMISVVGRTVQVWDCMTGKLLASIPHDNRISRAAFNPAGDRIAILTENSNEVNVWDSATGRVVLELTHVAEVRHLSFSPDGKWIVTTSKSNAHIRDAVTGKTHVTLPHTGPVGHAAFSPDSRYVVTSCSDLSWAEREAQIWDVESGKKIGQPLKHRDGVSSATFSPDGRRVATASEDFTAQVWDPATGLPSSQLLKHKQQVHRVEFSPDGRWVVTLSADKTTRLWDTQTGEPITPPMKHDWPPYAASFLGQGRRLLTKRLNGESLIWELPQEARPVADLVLLSELLSGQHIDQNGGGLPLTKESLREHWQTLNTKYPDSFRTSEAEALLWHEREAEKCERDKQWFAAVFHLDRLLGARPGDASLGERKLRAQERLARTAD